MNTVAIDSKVLNSLLDNQKKLDDLFDAIFDDEPFFIHSATSSSAASSLPPSFDDDRTIQEENRGRAFLLAIKERHSYFLIMPVLLEVAAIYFVVNHLL